MAVHRKYDIAAIVVVVLCILAYASFRPKFRLRPEMPVEFFDASRLAPARRVSEERIANAYWKCAVSEVQWKYGYAQRLPDDPPAEFSVKALDAVDNAAARVRYWKKLRELWGVTAIWQKQYEWNTISLRDSLQSAGKWLEEQMRRITGYA
jgi:hypothetical protein